LPNLKDNQKEKMSQKPKSKGGIKNLIFFFAISQPNFIASFFENFSILFFSDFPTER
jgi:hypothetical protein